MVDAPTRERVARTLLELGPSTAGVLAERLDLTAAAVRRHLDQMVAEGAVEPREPRVHGARGRGRPARLFAITDAGRDRFDQQYDDLAVQALRFLEETGGDKSPHKGELDEEAEQAEIEFNSTVVSLFNRVY